MSSTPARRQRQTRGRAAALAFGLIFCVAANPPAAAGQTAVRDLSEMSLEELLAIKVTSAGKKDQLIAETPAAVYVITADDIRRSNASTITEILRQVPGILVARLATGEWSISIRGFNDNNANKLLVLMDGRTLYSPLYAGVEWDTYDTMIEDIERIEVVRGPGAALWGANAVNGVINIITKPAADTPGGLVALQTGMFEKGSGAARYGGAAGKTAHYRLFTKYFTRSSLQDGAGNTPYGGWTMFRTGGRLDWSPTSNDTITLSGDWAQSTLRETDDEITALTPPFESRVQENDLTKTGFVLTRWTHKLPNGSELDGRFFYNRHVQSDALGHDKDQSIETADFEFNHHLRVRDRHDLVWGGGLRQVRDTVKPVFNTFFTPESSRARTYNGFVQDEIAFRGNTVRFTAGSKFEWNAFSKFEVQPTARLLWAATDRHSIWTAVSRAVRVPSREEHGQNELDSIGLDDNGAIEYSTIVASPLFKPEKLTAFEAGYRFVTPKRLSLDVATFYNVYDDLQTLDVQPSVFTTSPIAGLLTPLAWTNHGYGRVLGAEVTAFWTVSPFLQISGNYTRLLMQLHADDADHHEDVHDIEAKNARNLLYARAYADLPQKVALAVELRYVGAIPGEDVPGYVDGNIHLSRAVREGLRLNVTLENFLHRRHAEWDGGGLVQSRALRAGFTWTF